MTISAPIQRRLPLSRNKKCANVDRLLDALVSLQKNQMIEIGGCSQSYISTTAHRYGFKVSTRRLESGSVGVWRITP